MITKKEATDALTAADGKLRLAVEAKIDEALKRYQGVPVRVYVDYGTSLIMLSAVLETCRAAGWDAKVETDTGNDQRDMMKCVVLS